MKKAVEILISFKTSEFKIYSEEEALKAMKLYAEQAVKHHLEKAAENAQCVNAVGVIINKQSIINTPIELL